MAYFNNINLERISEEANGGILPFSTDESETLAELGFETFINDFFSSDFSLAGTCDLTKLTESITNSVEPNELNAYLGPAISQHLSSDHENSRALINNLPEQTIKRKPKHSNTKPIALSQSVGVGLPQKLTECSPKISISNPLEEFYRPRYKSDYFTQSGKTRKPRYVADRLGNHFITIKVQPGAQGVIRIDWLTIPNAIGDLYSMPYRFQQNNALNNVPDCNPMYMDIKADEYGVMKIYLVLIKSKQDELKILQPLKPFHPFQDAFGIPDKKTPEDLIPLTPKQLIQKYQLDKSQLAFTFCALSSDRKAVRPEWDTTVYSTVLTELPPPENAKQKTVTCPKCTHLFPLPTPNCDDHYSVQETTTNKRPVKRYIIEEPVPTMKKQKNYPIEFIN